MESVEDYNLFMMCESLETSALSKIPRGFHSRYCRSDEIDLWLEFPFDHSHEVDTHKRFMVSFFERVYKPRQGDFLKSCLFLCDSEDVPVATCFLWNSYEKINTIHWLKVRKDWEGRGLGRAVLSLVLEDTVSEDYPIYLHTQPGSFRAIKLYLDFGFRFIDDPMIGDRPNQFKQSLAYLRKNIPEHFLVNKLDTVSAPIALLDAANSGPFEF